MRRASFILFSALALLLTAGGAAGQDEATPPPKESHRRSVEILANLHKPQGQQSWLSYHLDHIHIDDTAGLAYTRPLRLAERDLELSLRGPALGHEGVGLSFEIRF